MLLFYAGWSYGNDNFTTVIVFHPQPVCPNCHLLCSRVYLIMSFFPPFCARDEASTCSRFPAILAPNELNQPRRFSRHPGNDPPHRADLINLCRSFHHVTLRN